MERKVEGEEGGGRGMLRDRKVEGIERLRGRKVEGEQGEEGGRWRERNVKG